MKTLTVLLIFVLSVLSVMSKDVEIKKGKIIVIVENIENDNGKVFSHIYDNSEYFPAVCKKAVDQKTSKVKSNRSVFVYDDLPFGTYALTVHHDENSNGKMDRNFVGIPSEGWGVSNNVTVLFSAPSFDECKFTLNSKSKTLTIKMKN